MHKLKVQSKKTYIIDTNVFVECPDICNKIDRNCQIILSAKVIDELDKLKITLEGSNKENVNKNSYNWGRRICWIKDHK